MRPKVIVLLSVVAIVVSACRSSGVESSSPLAHLRILAYNIHHGEGMDEVIDLERIALLIDTLQPDLVAIQEVDSVVDRTNDVDQIQVLAQLTGMTPAFGRFMSYQGGAYGMGLLSRLPVLAVDNLRLPDGDEPRTALMATVRLATGDTLDFVGIHFYRTDAERLAQAHSLEDHLSDRSHPVILAGDFNSLPGLAVMSFLGKTYTIVDKGEDRYTFPSTDPEKEIDFILYRPAETFEVARNFLVDEPVASDHRPVVVDLVIQ